MTVSPADHRYLQVARTLRKEIVDGVYPVGSQLPTEHELCERFEVSRYTVREALRRLRDDNLVASRPRAGTLVVPRPAANSYAQDVMSINDLLAFAAGAQFAIESNAMVTIDDALAATDRAEGRIGVAGRPRLPASRRRRSPGLHDRVLHQPRVRRGRPAAATTLRADLPADRGPVRGQHRRGAPGDLRGRGHPRTRRRAEGRDGHRRTGDAAHLQDVRRRGRPGHDQHPSLVAVPALDDDAPGQGAGRTVRVDEQRTADAYRRGLWVTRRSPTRFATPPGPRRIERCWWTAIFGSTARGLHEQATALAQALMARMPAGSVVSFMLPNWHEAAVIYLGATLAGMVVNPILPSLRDRELQFILSDADSRAIFVPSDLRRPRLRRDAGPRDRRACLAAGGRGGARRCRSAHAVRVAVRRNSGTAALPVLEPRRRAHDPLHLGHHGTPERRSAHAIIRSTP